MEKKIKEKYPELYTLDGFTESFDTNILINMDFIFFYVGCMNHATYQKAVNVLKNNKIPYKYIGKTNIDLVEKEMIEELDKYYC